MTGALLILATLAVAIPLLAWDRRAHAREVQRQADEHWQSVKAIFATSDVDAVTCDAIWVATQRARRGL